MEQVPGVKKYLTNSAIPFLVVGHLGQPILNLREPVVDVLLLEPLLEGLLLDLALVDEALKAGHLLVEPPRANDDFGQLELKHKKG